LKESGTRRLTVSLPVDDYEQINRVSNRDGVSIAWVIRKAIAEYLEKDSPLFGRLSQ